MTSQAAVACALVADSLKERPRSAAEILAAAEGAKVSPRSIQRAAEQLGVVKTRAGFKGGWTWRLPAGDGYTTETPTEQQAANMLSHVEVPVRIEHAESVKDHEMSEQSPSRAEVIATRLRKLEAGRGKTAPIYSKDSRLLRWVQAGISDPDLREAYERAVTDIKGDGPVTAGLLDRYVTEILTETRVAA